MYAHCAVSSSSLSKKSDRTARAAYASEERVDVKAYMAGNKVKKSSISSSVIPFESFSTPDLISSFDMGLDGEDEDERYSFARCWRAWIGMQPLRWACNSAFGRDWRKVIWDGLNASNAAKAGQVTPL